MYIKRYDALNSSISLRRLDAGLELHDDVLDGVVEGANAAGAEREEALLAVTLRRRRRRHQVAIVSTAVTATSLFAVVLSAEAATQQTMTKT